MIYIAANWIHDNDTKPIQVFSEVGDDGVETRKIERFRDGSIVCADSHQQSNGTMLGTINFESIDDNSTPIKFEVDEISRETFDRLWFQHRQNKL